MFQLPLCAHFTHASNRFLWTRYQRGCIQKHVVTKNNYGGGDMLLKITNNGGYMIPKITHYGGDMIPKITNMVATYNQN